MGLFIKVPHSQTELVCGRADVSISMMTESPFTCVTTSHWSEPLGVSYCHWLYTDVSILMTTQSLLTCVTMSYWNEPLEGLVATVLQRQSNVLPYVLGNGNFVAHSFLERMTMKITLVATELMLKESVQPCSSLPSSRSTKSSCLSSVNLETSSKQDLE